MKIKLPIAKKISLFLVGLTALLGLVALPVFAEAPVPVPDTQCQGDEKSCTCPTDFPNCGTDPVLVPDNKCAETFPNNSQSYTICKEKTDLFKKYVNPIIALLSFGVGLAVVIGIIVGGMKYISSAGDPQKAADGKRHIFSAIMALVVYLLLFALLNFLIPGGIL